MITNNNNNKTKIQNHIHHMTITHYSESVQTWQFLSTIYYRCSWFTKWWWQSSVSRRHHHIWKMFINASQVERLCRHRWNVQYLAVLRFTSASLNHTVWWIWRWHFAFTVNCIQSRMNAVLRNLFYLNSNRQHKNTIHWNRYVRMCIQNTNSRMFCACFYCRCSCNAARIQRF